MLEEHCKIVKVTILYKILHDNISIPSLLSLIYKIWNSFLEEIIQASGVEESKCLITNYYDSISISNGIVPCAWHLLLFRSVEYLFVSDIERVVKLLASTQHLHQKSNDAKAH